MVTIKQVAAHAGTSFKTVSRVINNDDYVSKETREKVQKAIEELGYLPNSAARMMRNQRSGVIGFIADEVSMTPHAIDIIRGAQELAWKHGKLLMVLNVQQDDCSCQKAIEQLLQYRAEGVIYAARFHKAVILPEALKKLRTVLVNCFSPSRNIASVVPDEYQAGFQLTTQLIKKGYKKIAFLNLNRRIIASSERQRGYLDALAAADMRIDDTYIRHAVIEENGEEINILPGELNKIMSLPDRPDAIICGKDLMAMEVYFQLSEKGLKVGRDIAIGSFDNMNCIADQLQPGLSTMALPHKAMGSWGMRYLLEERDDIEHACLPCEFIDRMSF